MIIGYFVFYVDHGDKENVFSEVGLELGAVRSRLIILDEQPKRWLERQKAALMGLPPPIQNIPASPSSNST